MPFANEVRDRLLSFCFGRRGCVSEGSRLQVAVLSQVKRGRAPPFEFVPSPKRESFLHSSLLAPPNRLFAVSEFD